MSLSLKIAGQIADLPEDFSLDLRKGNAFFEREELTSDFSNEFSLPFSVRNDLILGEYRNPQVLVKTSKFYCEQVVNTHLLARGYVIPFEAVDSYSLGFTTSLADTFGNNRTKSLREIDFGTIAIPSNFNSTLGNSYDNGGFVFPMIDNTDFYANPQAGFSGFINDFSAGAYLNGTKVPMFFVWNILNRIADLVGFDFQHNIPETYNWILYNTQSLDNKSVITIQDHLPDITVGQFILQFAKMTNSAVYMDVPNRVLTFKTRKSILNAECTLDWSRKSSPIKGKVPVNITGFDIKYNLDSDDATAKIITPIFQNYQTAGITAEELADLQPFELEFSSLKMENGIPYTRQAGITDFQADKKFTPRLLQWVGLSGGIPLATSETANFSFDLNATNGVVNTYYKEDELFQMNTFRTPTINLYLSETDLSEWTPDRKVHINGVNYIFEEINCPLHNLKQGCTALGWRTL
ncbi:MAG: hypothetical protein MUF12_00635 [Sediminibacterium sp.]|jgi:hypothetical protein|nr:hypothetical protein [Sediminibacterium sp.]